MSMTNDSIQARAVRLCDSYADECERLHKYEYGGIARELGKRISTLKPTPAQPAVPEPESPAVPEQKEDENLSGK